MKKFNCNHILSENETIVLEFKADVLELSSKFSFNLCVNPAWDSYIRT